MKNNYGIPLVSLRRDRKYKRDGASTILSAKPLVQFVICHCFARVPSVPHCATDCDRQLGRSGTFPPHCATVRNIRAFVRNPFPLHSSIGLGTLRLNEGLWPCIPVFMTTPNADVSPSRLIDAFGREITYVRISVTDRCNLRCRYCMPSESPEWMERDQVLSFEEIERFVRVAAAEGIRKVRLTGGEPLVRRDLPHLVKRLAAVPGLKTISMTTNATLLARHARELKDAGLTRLNVSLDSLQPDRFNDITKSALFEQVWDGIRTAIGVGFTPLKVNVVVIRDFNDDEVVKFALLTRDYPVHVRFIEYMPIGGDSGHWSRDKVVPCAEMQARIFEQVEIEPEDVDADGQPAGAASTDAGPEQVWKVRGGGRLGFISPVSDDFCARCNRVRLTSDGMLRGCLMRDGEADFRSALRRGATDDEIRDILHEAIGRKPEKHLINSPEFQHSEFYTMNRLGG